MPCSGIHRSLGTHVTQVRSVDLDTWKPEWLEVMKTWGNTKANAVWEAKMPRDFEGKPTEKEAQDLTPKMQKFIRDKYERKKWYSEAKKRFSKKSQANSEDEEEESEEEEEIEEKPKKSSSKTTSSTVKKSIPVPVISQTRSITAPSKSAPNPTPANQFVSFNPFENDEPQITTQPFSDFTSSASTKSTINSGELLSFTDMPPVNSFSSATIHNPFNSAIPIEKNPIQHLQQQQPPPTQSQQQKPAIDLSSLYGASPAAIPTQQAWGNQFSQHQPQQQSTFVQQNMMFSQPSPMPSFPQQAFQSQPVTGFPLSFQTQQSYGFPFQQQQQQHSQPAYAQPPQVNSQPFPVHGFTLSQQPVQQQGVVMGGGMFPPQQQQPAKSSTSYDPFSNLM